MVSSMKLLPVALVTVQAWNTVKGAPVMQEPEQVADAARQVLPSDREGFAVLHLDSRNALRSIEVASVGSLNASIVHPREVFKGAILANAASIILSHNHPSGNAEPSEEDLAITRRIKECGRLIGIDLLDHVIVTDSQFTSFKERKLLR